MHYFLLLPVIVATTILLTQLAKSIAVKLNIFIDLPNQRSSHSKAVPRCGGLAIIIVFFLSILIFFAPALRDIKIIGYLSGAAVIALVGLIDDLTGLKGKRKIAGMVLSAVVPIVFGLKLEYLGIVGHNPIMLYILSVVWIYGMVNAFNFMDGIDGLVGGHGVIYAFFLAGLALMGQNYFVLSMSFVLLAACLGFLSFNYSPASVFMGDIGSMFLGYNFAVLSLLITNGSLDRIPIYVFVLIFGVLIYDSMVTFVRRGLEGKNVIEAHREHLYQRLIILGMPHRDVSMIYYILSLIFGIAAVIFLYVPFAGKGGLSLAMLALLIGFSFYVRRLERQRRVDVRP